MQCRLWLIFAALTSAFAVDECGTSEEVCNAGYTCYQSVAGSFESFFCKKCEKTTYKTLTGNATCIVCPKGFVCSSKGLTTPTPCNAGRYETATGLGAADDEPECKACTPGRRSTGTTQYPGATSCTDCLPGFAGSGNSHICSTCSASSGSYQPEKTKTSCLKCANGERRVTTAADGTTLLPNTASKEQVCIPCETGRFQPTRTQKSHDCNGKTCTTTTYSNEAGQENKVKSTWSRSTCYKCPEGRYQNGTSKTSCKSCAKGKFHSSSGKTSVDACTSAGCTQGYWCDNDRGFLYGNCGGTPCSQDGTSTTLHKSKKVPCPTSRYGPSTGLSDAAQCTKCSAGKWQFSTHSAYDGPHLTSDGQCTKCTKGLWSSSTGKGSKCTSKCAGGKWGAGSGMSAAVDCVGECSAGKWSNIEGFYEDNQCGGRCAIGKWSNQSGFTTGSKCSLCKPGLYADLEGNTVCLLCQVGRFIKAPGATVCESCLAGEYADQAGKSVCDLCAHGRYSADYNLRVFCRECFGGRWSNFSGASALSECTRLQCPSFTPPPRTTIKYTNNRTLPSNALLSFEHGYEASFDPNVICVWSGLPPDQVLWSGLDLKGQLPRAIGVQCDVLPTPNNGRVNFTNDRRFPAKARFRCEKGYSLVTESGIVVANDTKTISCTRDRQWNESAPGCQRVSCPSLVSIMMPANKSKTGTAQANVVIAPIGDTLPDAWDALNQTADWKFMDRAQFSCDVYGIMPVPHKQSVCTSHGTWDPDPVNIVCAAVPCENVLAAPGKKPMPSAMVLWVKFQSENKVLFRHWEPVAATSVIDFECAPNAVLMINNNVSTDRCRECMTEKEPLPTGQWQETIPQGSDVCCSIRVTCTPPQPEGNSPYGPLSGLTFSDVNPSAPLDPYYRKLECRCKQGYINVEDTRRSRCVQCEDNTYAPLLHGVRRVECRACPRDGVSCQGGVLKIKEDWWYDVKLYENRPALTRGMGPSTELYKCPHREACLVASELVPETMYCDENHTGIMCSSCYHRRATCGRGGRGRDDSCVGPDYFERGQEWMFFGVMARHCVRCPAGRQAILPLLITIVVAIGAIFVIAGIIVMQLNDVEHRIKQLAKGQSTDHNASGPIARLLLNWLQATALLSTIKLTPPEAVQDVTVYADYAQGISTDWYAIACTIRLNVWSTFAWNLSTPIIASLLPAIMVLAQPPIRRTLTLLGRTCKRNCNCCKLPEAKHEGGEGNFEAEGEDSSSEGEDEAGGSTLHPGLAPLHPMRSLLPLAPLPPMRSLLPLEEKDAAPTDAVLMKAVVEYVRRVRLSGGAPTLLFCCSMLEAEWGKSGCGSQKIRVWFTAAMAAMDRQGVARAAAAVVQTQSKGGRSENASRVPSLLPIPATAAPAASTQSYAIREIVELAEEISHDAAAAVVQTQSEEGGSENASRVPSLLPTPESEFSRSSDDESDSDESVRASIDWSDARQAMPRTMDARFGFWKNVSGRAIALRSDPKSDAQRTGFIVFPDDVFRAEQVSIDGEFLQLRGSWGSGWVPTTHEGVAIVLALPAGMCFTTLAYEYDSLPPLVGIEEETIQKDNTLSTESALESQVRHRYRALLALCPEGGINFDVIDSIFPISTTSYEIDEFMQEYDIDGDGRLNFREYVSADPEICKRWRHKNAWHTFALADVDQDGVLNEVELQPLLPMTVQDTDLGRWMKRFDKAGAHGSVTIADVAAIDHTTQRDDLRTIVSASISMSVFLVYIKTAKQIMLMFSTETIEGVKYLKSDISQKAYTGKHLAGVTVAAVYGSIFVIGVPVGAAYILYLNRKQTNNRHIQAAFGFLFEGYRAKMFFWEFVVLLRKVLFLAVALFWADAFLQSIVALFVIIASTVLHLICWPYEQEYLNVVELLTLLSLFSLVSLSLLLWYIHVPGNDTYLVLYELSVTLILFLEYSFIFSLLIGRFLHISLREKSLKIATIFPFAKPALRLAIKVEAWVYFQTSSGKTMNDQCDKWSWLENEEALKVKTADEKNAAMREKLLKLHRVASKIFSIIPRKGQKEETSEVDTIDERGPLTSANGSTRLVALELLNPLTSSNAKPRLDTLNPLALSKASDTRNPLQSALSSAATTSVSPRRDASRFGAI